MDNQTDNEDGEPLLGPDGQPLLGPDGKPLMKKDGQPLLEPNDAPPIDTTQAEADTKSQGDADAKSQGEADTKSQGEADAKSQGEADTKSQGEADAKSQAEADAKSQAEADAKSQAEADTKSQGEADAKSQAEADTKSQAEADTKSQAEADTKSQAEADTKSQAEADTKSQAEADTKSQGEADAKAQAEAAAKSQAEADTKSQAGADIKSQGETDAKSQAEKKRKSQGKANGQPVTEKDKASVVPAKSGQPPSDNSKKPDKNKQRESVDKSDLTKLQTELAQQKADFEAKLKEKQCRLDECCMKVRDLQRERNCLKNEVCRIKQLEGEIVTSQSKVRSLECEIDMLQSYLQKQQVELSNLLETIAKQQCEIDSNMGIVHKFREICKQRDELLCQLNALKDGQGKTQTNACEMQTLLQEQERLKQENCQLKDANIKKKEVEEERDNLLCKIDQLEKVFKNQEQEFQCMSKKLNDKEECINLLQEALKEAECKQAQTGPVNPCNSQAKCNARPTNDKCNKGDTIKDIPSKLSEQVNLILTQRQCLLEQHKYILEQEQIKMDMQKQLSLQTGRAELVCETKELHSEITYLTNHVKNYLEKISMLEISIEEFLETQNSQLSLQNTQENTQQRTPPQANKVVNISRSLVSNQSENTNTKPCPCSKSSNNMKQDPILERGFLPIDEETTDAMNENQNSIITQSEETNPKTCPCSKKNNDMNPTLEKRVLQLNEQTAPVKPESLPCGKKQSNCTLCTNNTPKNQDINVQPPLSTTCIDSDSQNIESELKLHNFSNYSSRKLKNSSNWNANTFRYDEDARNVCRPARPPEVNFQNENYVPPPTQNCKSTNSQTDTSLLFIRKHSGKQKDSVKFNTTQTITETIDGNSNRRRKSPQTKMIPSTNTNDPDSNKKLKGGCGCK